MKEQVIKLWPSTPVQADDLPVDNRPAVTRRSHCFPKLSERIERVTVAGDEMAATVLDDGERTKTVVLQFEKILRMVERRRSS